MVLDFDMVENIIGRKWYKYNIPILTLLLIVVNPEAKT